MPQIHVRYALRRVQKSPPRGERTTTDALLGMQSLRDVHVLRSGEEWHPALLRHIEQADIFQLYWSNNAKHSTYVEHEWRHALTQTRPSFIRPLYWEQPMPDPPPELAAIHFAYFPLDR
jgi:hypothetical protein